MFGKSFETSFCLSVKKNYCIKKKNAAYMSSTSFKVQYSLKRELETNKIYKTKKILLYFLYRKSHQLLL